MEENSVEEVPVKTATKSTCKKLARMSLILLLSLVFAFSHYKYSSTLFENDRNFAYLSELEREMSLRTEMGFYYSYYKILAQDFPFSDGLSRLLYDTMVEHPKEINAFNRFNIHPEVIIASIFRYFEPWLNDTKHVECFMVQRPGMRPVESCVGLGVPIMFYLEAVWTMAGLAIAAVFLHATMYGESILGGFLAICQFYANHKDLTRVHWTPNERENFAWPLVLLQSWMVSLQLRDKDRLLTFQLQLGIFILNSLSLLFWQFSQFIFLTQTFIFFIMEQLNIIDIKTLCIFLHAHFCGIHMAVLLLQGNDMLKSSLYTSLFVSIAMYCLFFSNLRIKVKTKLDFFVEAWLVLLRIGIVVISSIYLKKVISDFLEAEEDNHIWDLLFSKFSDSYANFHTLLYTCSGVYGFLPIETIYNLFKTSLIPIVLISGVMVVTKWIQSGIIEDVEEETENVKKETQDDEDEEEETDNVKKETQDDEDSGIENNSETKLRQKKIKPKSKDLDEMETEIVEKMEDRKRDRWVEFLSEVRVEPDVFYCFAQLVVYGIMAALIMRLKLLFVTQLCIASALFANTKYYIIPKTKKPYSKYMPLLWILLLIPMAYSLVKNMSQELSYLNEYNDPKLEELILWVKNSTIPTGAFAGSMPMMATVMLTTRRPIVLHPHYEHLNARERAFAVYKVYGRFTSLELYQELSKLQASYLVVEWRYCYGRSVNNCTYSDIWDRSRPDLRTQPLLCRMLHTQQVQHFYPVFDNGDYSVYKVHDMSLRYMPRSFDT